MADTHLSLVPIERRYPVYRLSWNDPDPANPPATQHHDVFLVSGGIHQAEESTLSALADALGGLDGISGVELVKIDETVSEVT